MIKPYRFLQRIAQLIAYAYSTLIAGYLILRLMFWDRLWPIALMGDFVPWIFLPIFLLPILGFFSHKETLVRDCFICGLHLFAGLAARHLLFSPAGEHQ